MNNRKFIKGRQVIWANVMTG